MQNRLRELRKSKGLTQGLLARKSGVHRTSIARYETGRISMSTKNLVKIAEALEVPVDAVLNGGQTDGTTSKCG